MCFRGAKQETTTSTPPSERQFIVPPWMGTGLEASPALALPPEPSEQRAEVAGRFKEKGLLSLMCFCVKQRFHCFQQIPGDLNE